MFIGPGRTLPFQDAAKEQKKAIRQAKKQDHQGWRHA
jgi:hypothetical protein